MSILNSEFLKFGFIPDIYGECGTFCVLSQQTLTNESMKVGRQENHLKAKNLNQDRNQGE